MPEGPTAEQLAHFQRETAKAAPAYTQRPKGRAVTALVTAAAPEAGIPLAIAGKAAEVAEKALTGDLVTIRTVKNVGTKKNPVIQETVAHVNPLALGLGAAAVGVAVFVGVSTWQGRSGGLLFGGTPPYKNNYDHFLTNHPKLTAKLKLHPSD